MRSKILNMMFSSLRLDYPTPQALFDQLDKEFHFTLDPCATKENAKCADFLTKKDDGLAKVWWGNVFMNPPYGRQIGSWIAKAKQEVDLGNANIVVCLIPARTDTKWWHDYCMKASEIRFIRGRIKFDSTKNAGAPFPSAIVIFKPEPKKA